MSASGSEVETLEFRGTWDEIRGSLPDFEQRRLHVTVRIEREPSEPQATVLDAALHEVWDNVPDEVWDQFPADFGENMDHYLYGAKRRK